MIRATMIAVALCATATAHASPCVSTPFVPAGHKVTRAYATTTTCDDAERFNAALFGVTLHRWRSLGEARRATRKIDLLREPVADDARPWSNPWRGAARRQGTIIDDFDFHDDDDTDDVG